MQGVIKFVKGWLLFSLLWGIFMWFMSWQGQGEARRSRW